VNNCAWKSTVFAALLNLSMVVIWTMWTTAALRFFRDNVFGGGKSRVLGGIPNIAYAGRMGVITGPSSNPSLTYSDTNIFFPGCKAFPFRGRVLKLFDNTKLLKIGYQLCLMY